MMPKITLKNSTAQKKVSKRGFQTKAAVYPFAKSPTYAKPNYSQLYSPSSSITTYDYFGNPLSTNSEECLNHLNEFHDAFTGFRDGLMSIYDATKADPTCVGANAIAASMDYAAGDSQSVKRGNFHLNNAKESSQKASNWERLWLDIAQNYSKGEVSKAIEGHFEIARQFPTDLTSATLCQFQTFHRGEYKKHLEIMDMIFDHHKGNGNIYGAVAFGHELLRSFDKAEKIAIEGLEISDHPWTHHAIAHLMDSQNRIEEGISFLEGRLPLWPQYIGWIGTHNAWHICLNLIQTKNIDRLINLFETKIWPNDPQYRSDAYVQVDAIALLWRFDLLDPSIAPALLGKWGEVSEWSMKINNGNPLIRPSPLPFADLHHFYAISRVNPSLAQQIYQSYSSAVHSKENYIYNNDNIDPTEHHENMEKNNEVKERLERIFLPFMRAIMYFHQKEYQKALDEVGDINEKMTFAMGGSHPQRRLFLTFINHLRERVQGKYKD